MPILRIVDNRVLLENVLEPREQLLWAGPRKRAAFPRERLLIGTIVVLVSVIFTGKSLVASSGLPPPYLVFALTGVAALLLLSSYHVYATATNTSYVLTNRRLLVSSGPGRDTVRAVRLAASGPVQDNQAGQRVDRRKP